MSLEKRHRLYVTSMTDLSDPTRPQILAVERRRARRRREALGSAHAGQRQEVRTHRVDMGLADPGAFAWVAAQPCVTDRSMWLRSSTRWLTLAKKYHSGRARCRTSGLPVPAVAFRRVPRWSQEKRALGPSRQIPRRAAVRVRLRVRRSLYGGTESRPRAVEELRRGRPTGSGLVRCRDIRPLETRPQLL